MDATARRVCEYIEGFNVQQGHGEGQPFKLLPWQRRYLSGVFAPGVSEAALSVARGNGKSALLGAVLAACVDPEGPLFAPRAVNIVVASNLQQARETFEAGRWMLAQRYDLSKRGTWAHSDSTNSVRLIHRPTGATIRALSSAPRGAHGLGAFRLALLDEPAQWETGTSDAMYSAINTSLGKLPGSRIAAIGTRPESSEHWFSKLLDVPAPGRFAASYRVPSGTPDKDLLTRRAWLRANPSAKHWPTLDQAIRKAARDARDDPRLLRQFRALRCNMGESDVSRAHLIEAADWASAGASPPEREGVPLWGVDLGGTLSGSAIVTLWPSGRAEGLLCLPTVPELAERERRDGAASGLYRAAVQSGALIIEGRRVPDVRALVAEAAHRYGPPSAIACDRYKLGELEDALEDCGLAPEFSLRRMGWHHTGEDADALRDALGGEFRPVRSPLWDWAMSRAVTRTGDIAEGYRIEKRRGDDLAVASALAAGLAKRDGERLANPPAPVIVDIV